MYRTEEQDDDRRLTPMQIVERRHHARSDPLRARVPVPARVSARTATASNLAIGKPVDIGEAVGIIAAQSIGEPGTQLTMRTFHTGGVAGSDITQGLPRVEELFEARKPKKAATLAEIGGVVSIEESKRTTVKTVNIVNPQTGDMRSYQLASSSGIRVTDGQEVPQGFQLNEGSLNPHDILRILDPRAVHDYEIKEVQTVYRQQGVDINDKHIEVIVRQMMRKVRVEDAGDAEVLPGSVMDWLEFEDYNNKVQARIDAGEEGLRLAIAEPTLMGITKASLATDSWLSAASFQETTTRADRCCDQGQGRSADGSEGERNHR